MISKKQDFIKTIHFYFIIFSIFDYSRQLLEALDILLHYAKHLVLLGLASVGTHQVVKQSRNNDNIDNLEK